MTSLICRDEKSAASSLSEVVGISEKRLVNYLTDDIHIQYENKNPAISIDFPTYLFERIIEVHNITALRKIDQIHWFHGTRLRQDSKIMSEGILPTNLIVPKLIEQINTLAFMNDIEKSKFNPKGCPFLNKIQTEMYWGPYGNLNRIAVIHPDLFRFHSYIDMPEIVEDYIQYAFYDNYSILVNLYKKMTRPAIIEFVTVPKNDDCLWLIKPILQFLYWSIHEEQYSTYCNTCYDGSGEPITPSQILKIEYL